MSHKSLVEATLSFGTALAFCIERSIVVSGPRCRHCDRVMKLSKHPRSITTPSIWKCPKKVCRATLSVFSGSFFSLQKLPLCQALWMTWYYFFGLGVVLVADMLGIDRHSVSRHFQHI